MPLKGYFLRNPLFEANVVQNFPVISDVSEVDLELSSYSGFCKLEVVLTEL